MRAAINTNRRPRGRCLECGAATSRIQNVICMSCSRRGPRNHNYKYGKEQHPEIWRQLQKANHPDRIAARKKLYGAIRSGRLLRLPCEVCGNPKSHGHHEDYSRPLDVKWMCRKHHDEYHRAAQSRAGSGEGQKP